MVTVSHIVQKYVEERPFIQESMIRGILSYGSLAEEMKEYVESELGKDVKVSAMAMALRRFSETLKKRYIFEREPKAAELIMKTNLCDICLVKSPSLAEKMRLLYGLVDFGKGETFNTIYGSYEVVIVANEKYKKKILQVLEGENVLNVEKGLVSLTLVYPENADFLHTQGVIFSATRRLVWENINIFEIISTNTELTFILSRNDLVSGYNALKNVVI
ncbi:MAG: hypothetical protein GXO64_03375 [Candidatus Micrarchaeota archaeon]|nr:hypothetical protein [Candidatus Micrarchaeota archaeon]